jgi:hypothetical protein
MRSASHASPRPPVEAEGLSDALALDTDDLFRLHANYYAACLRLLGGLGVGRTGGVPIERQGGGRMKGFTGLR